jgi:acyl transferase domain-containing protein/acyl carrier protein
LYTDEAVATNAIIESYRETVITASTTVNLETGAGHASRCAVTPFTHEFQQLKDKYISEGLSGYQLREELEKLTLGRLRLATKGLKRDCSGIISVSGEESYRDGMYMLGQSAALLGEKTTIAELHHRLTNGTVNYLWHLAQQTTDLSIKSPAVCKVAIVAMDCMMPDSTDINRFWDVLFSGEDVVKEVPKDRWDPGLYYSPEKSDLDRVYSKWGGFLPPIDIDTVRLGIPPVSLKKIEPLQILTLELVTRLFEKSSIRFDQDIRDRTCIFLGAGGGIGDMGGKYAARSEVERIVATDKADIYSRLPEWGDETFPGLLFNVVAGRVANRLNLKGASFTVDAACASSLAAVYAAFRELNSFNCDLAIAGGVDTGQSPFAFLCFSRSQALSPTGRSRSFDQEANGIAISEGLGIVVMKRLDDALRDGDHIVAVIDGVGAASDGRGSSLTSPQTTGQQLAVERAWRSADCSPACMSLYEAHGTGTVAGDRTEIETVVATMRRHSASPQACAVSSTKPNIGHTKSSAGIAGLMHASLCIQHRVLSPQIGASRPLEPLTDPLSPIFINQAPAFWPSPLHGRKAGVSAFGFGGTNYHIVLSEPPVRSHYHSAWQKTSSYLFTWHSSDIEGLRSGIADFVRTIRASSETSLHQLSYLHWCQAMRTVSNQLAEYRASAVASSIDQLLGKLDLILSAPSPEQAVNRLDDSTFLAHCSSGHTQRPVAFLIPGQGALREHYLDELLVSIDAVKNSLDMAVSSGSVDSKLLCDLLLRRSSSSSSPTDIRLIPMAELQPLICAIQLGLCDALVSYGLRPDVLVGHSLGELTATGLAGLWPQRDLFFQLVRKRGTQMDIACQDLDSGMLATSLTDPDQLSPILQDCEATYISNYNSSSQITISGPIVELERIVPRIKLTGEKATRLSVSGAFHSPMMQQASDVFAEQLITSKLCSPALKVLSLVDSQYYGADASENLSRLTRHMTASVNLVNGIGALDQHPYIFINIGPSKTLDKLVREIRNQPEDIFISLDDGSNDIGGYYNALAHLYCLLPDFCPSLGRAIIPSARQFKCNESSAPSAIVNNGMAYMASDVPYPSLHPPLSADSAAAEAQLPSKDTGPATMLVPQSSTLARAAHQQETSTNSFSSLRPLEMSPLNHNTSVQILSIYSETIRQLLASQERVTMALLSSSGADSSSGSSVLPPFTPTSLSPASLAPPGVDAASPQPFADFELAFIDPLLPSDAMSQVSKPSSTPAADPIPMPASVAAPEPRVLVPLGEVDNSSQIGFSSPPDFATLLIDIMSDLTGYPPDMLQPELALEADLGIDSIKRVEIFARLQKAVSSDLRESIKSKTDDLAAAPRIADIIDILSALPVSTGK